MLEYPRAAIRSVDSSRQSVQSSSPLRQSATRNRLWLSDPASIATDPASCQKSYRLDRIFPIRWHRGSMLPTNERLYPQRLVCTAQARYRRSAVRIVLAPGASAGVNPRKSRRSSVSDFTPKSASSSAWSRNPAARRPSRKPSICAM